MKPTGVVFEFAIHACFTEQENEPAVVRAAPKRGPRRGKRAALVQLATVQEDEEAPAEEPAPPARRTRAGAARTRRQAAAEAEDEQAAPGMGSRRDQMTWTHDLDP